MATIGLGMAGSLTFGTPSTTNGYTERRSDNGVLDIRGWRGGIGAH
jgi:hypothetical protein